MPLTGRDVIGTHLVWTCPQSLDPRIHCALRRAAGQGCGRQCQRPSRELPPPRHRKAAVQVRTSEMVELFAEDPLGRWGSLQVKSWALGLDRGAQLAAETTFCPELSIPPGLAGPAARQKGGWGAVLLQVRATQTEGDAEANSTEFCSLPPENGRSS